MAIRRLLACRAWILLAGLAAGLPAHAEEPLPLAVVIERALSYDPQVRSAQAELEALRRAPAEAVDRDDVHGRRGLGLRGRSDQGGTDRAAPVDAVALDRAERALRRAREQAAARTAATALELQRQDRLVQLARQRLGAADRYARPAAEAALGDAQAARRMALAALEAQAGSLAQGVAAFEWPPTVAADLLGDEEAARRRSEQLATRLREARSREDGEPVPALELQAIDAAHALAMARLGEQFRLGTWQRTLAEGREAVAGAAAPSAEVAERADDPRPALDAALARWLAAWRSKDLARYLASYAPGFATAGMDAAQWRAQRTKRLAQPGRITIEIDAPRWDRVEPGTVEVRFTQQYRSPAYADVTSKRLVWRLGDDGWRIVREEAAPAHQVASSR